MDLVRSVGNRQIFWPNFWCQKMLHTFPYCKSAAGVAVAMQVMNPLWKTQRQADPTHLSQTQFRECL